MSELTLQTCTLGILMMPDTTEQISNVRVAMPGRLLCVLWSARRSSLMIRKSTMIMNPDRRLQIGLHLWFILPSVVARCPLPTGDCRYVNLIVGVAGFHSLQEIADRVNRIVGVAGCPFPTGDCR